MKTPRNSRNAAPQATPNPRPGPFGFPSDQQEQSAEGEDAGRRIGKAARSPFRVLKERGAEQCADRHRDKEQDQRQRPARRQEAAVQREHDERQQQNERQITEIGVAEDEHFERAEIAKARAAVVEDGLAAFERLGDIARQQMLRDLASPAPINETIITAIERPQAADEARIVDRNRKQRQGDQREGQNDAAPPPAHQQPDNGHDGEHDERGRERLPQMDGHGRVETHRELTGLDRDAIDAPPDISRLDRAAGPERIGQQRELLRSLLPDDVAAPAQIAAGILRRETISHEERHAELPAMQSHPEPAVALRACQVVRPRPVVAKVVDETEAQPDRIGEIDVIDLARHLRAAQDSVGGKRKDPIGKCKSAPAAIGGGIAAFLRRIRLVEFGRQQPIDIGRQSGDKGVVLAVRKKDIVPLLDRRRIEDGLAGDRDHGEQDREQPGPVARGHLTCERDHGRGGKQGIAKQVIERQSDDRPTGAPAASGGATGRTAAEMRNRRRFVPWRPVFILPP